MLVRIRLALGSLLCFLGKSPPPFLFARLPLKFLFVFEEEELLEEDLLVFVLAALQHVVLRKLPQPLRLKQQRRLLTFTFQLLLELRRLVPGRLHKHRVH